MKANLSLDFEAIDKKGRHVKDLLLRMIELDSKKRISAAEAL